MIGQQHSEEQLISCPKQKLHVMSEEDIDIFDDDDDDDIVEQQPQVVIKAPAKAVTTISDDEDRKRKRLERFGGVVAATPTYATTGQSVTKKGRTSGNLDKPLDAMVIATATAKKASQSYYSGRGRGRGGYMGRGRGRGRGRGGRGRGRGGRYFGHSPQGRGRGTHKNKVWVRPEEQSGVVEDLFSEIEKHSITK